MGSLRIDTPQLLVYYLHYHHKQFPIFLICTPPVDLHIQSFHQQVAQLYLKNNKLRKGRYGQVGIVLSWRLEILSVPCFLINDVIC